jgi:hypothetical protein
VRLQTDIRQHSPHFTRVNRIASYGNVGATGAVLMERWNCSADGLVQHFCRGAQARRLAKVNRLGCNQRLDCREPRQQINLRSEFAGCKRGLRGDVFSHFGDRYCIEGCGLGMNADLAEKSRGGFLQGQETC